MNMMRRSGSPVRTRTRTRRFSHAAQATSIHYATACGGIVAFALLCIVSARAVVQGQIALAVGPAAIAWQGLAALLFVLTILTTVAWAGWCRMRALLKRTVATARVVESEWQRRYAAIETRELAARGVVASQMMVAANQERDEVQATMRHFVVGPLAALGCLLEALNDASLPPTQRPLVGRIHCAVRTWARALEDMLAATPVEPRTIALDETLTDVRELIDGVVALFSQIATQKSVYLSASVDQSVDARVLADGARLGQIIFHLLSRAVRTTEHGQIMVAARAETLNAGSQRIFVSVTAADHYTPAPSTCSMQMQLPSLFDAPVPEGALRDEDASSLELCRQLAQYMRGELTVSREAGPGTCSMFSAPFTTEHPQALNASDRVNRQTTLQTIVEEPPEGSPVPLAEPFDRNYLDALLNEGIDLRTFIYGWRRSVDDDLQKMRGRRTGCDTDGMRTLLHRLSGAVGLVGAHSLMDALRRASAIHPESAGRMFDELEKRIAALMMQLDHVIEPHRSNLQ